MPWTGSAPNQTFVRSDGTRTGTTVWQEADGAGVDIIATDHDTHDQDIGTSLNLALKKDGGNTPTANLPMGGYKHTGVGDAAALTQYLTLKQRLNGVGGYIATVGGTASAITLTTGYTLTAYVAGMSFRFIVGTTNTGATTLNVDGLGAKSILRQNGDALEAYDLESGVIADVTYNGTAFKLVSRALNDSGSSDVLARITPVGTIMPWPTATIPAGWLECDGSAISRTDYAELFGVLGETYGNGDGSTTFNKPDLRGQFLRGHDDGAGTDPDAASRTDRGDGTTGDEVGTKQADDTAAHTHGAGSYAADSNGAHTHEYNARTTTAGGATGGQVNNNVGLTSYDTGSNGAHTHTVSGTSGSTGGNETRPTNVAVKFIILALPAAASADVLGVNGHYYKWATSTSGDPGSGKVAVNNATLSSATGLQISETDAAGAGVGGALALWDDSTSTTKGTLFIYKVGALSTFCCYTITGSITDSGDYDEFTLTHAASNGTFAAGDVVSVLFVPKGDKGETGTTGATGATGPNVGLDFAWATATSGDPGSGFILANNATLGSATALNISTTGRNGEDYSTHLATWDDSTSSVKGHLRLFTLADKTEYVEADVTGITDNSTYYTVALSNVSGGTAPSASDIMAVLFIPTGSAGLDGSDGTNAGLSYTFSTTTTDSDPGAGYVRANNADLSAATALYIDDDDANGNTVETELLTWDDATNATTKGKLILTNQSDGAAVVYDITGASTDATGYVKLSVTYSAGATSFANDSMISVQFAPAGNDGGGSGDVTAAAAFAVDNVLVRSDGTGKGVQATGIGVDDSDNVTGVNNVTGADTNFVTGTAGTSGNLAMWNADGDAVDSSVVAANVLVDGDIGSAVAAATSGTSVLKGDGSGGTTAAAATDLGAGKHMIFIPAIAMVSRTTNGAASGSVETSTNKNMIKTLDFDASTAEYAQFEIAMPPSWNEGTVTGQIVWSHPSTTTNFGVVFGLQAVARSDGDAIEAAFGTPQTMTDTGGTTNTLYVSPESSAITIAGTPAAGDVVQFELYRAVSDGSDTMAVDARIHGIRVYITTDALTDA